VPTSADTGTVITLLSRRALLAAALALPALGPDQALAAIKPPLKPKPERVKPLGVWSMKQLPPTTDVGDVASVVLFFRPAVNIERPVMRWWMPRWLPAATAQARFCVPENLSNQTILDPMFTGVMVPIPLDISAPASPPRPVNIGQGEARSCNNWRVLAQTRRTRAYRVFVDLADPATCRRASFGFNIKLVDDFPGPAPEPCPP
jgi:hypothetical protein